MCEFTLPDLSGLLSIYVDQSWKKQIPGVSVVFENRHRFAWRVAKFLWCHHANGLYLHVICEGHMIWCNIMRLFSNGTLKKSVSSLRSSQLWVHIHFSDKKITNVFSQMRKPKTIYEYFLLRMIPNMALGGESFLVSLCTLSCHNNYIMSIKKKNMAFKRYYVFHLKPYYLWQEDL